MNDESIVQSILSTISFFDVLDYPVTNWEVWRHAAIKDVPLEKIVIVLDELAEKKKIETHNGFFFLNKRQGLVEKRQEKHEISEKFWDKAIAVTKLLSYLPFIKLIAGANSLAFFNCKQASDIDLFIITTKDKIWTARALSTTLLHLLNIRRYSKRIAGKICLSFYVSEEKMDLRYTATDGLESFVALWNSKISPILDRDNTFEKFIEENAWMKEYFPNLAPNIMNYYTNFKKPFLSDQILRFFELLLKPRFIEKIAKLVQLPLIKNKHKKLGYPSSALHDDHILKFHPWDYPQESNTVLPKSWIWYKQEVKKRMDDIG